MKKFIKILKSIAIIFLFIIAVITIAIIWPLSELKMPDKHSSILLKNANIIDVETGEIFKNRDILIKENIIFKIDSSGNALSTSTASLIIDVSGQFIIPGLWDMHTHSNQHSPWLHHPIYIANGVTGVRDMSGQLDRKDSYWVGSRERLMWNAELKTNSRITPRYVLQSSYQMDGSASVPDGFPSFFKLSKESDVDSLLGFYREEKVDFIKIYQQIPSNVYQKLAVEAPRYNMYLAGHKPVFVTLEDAVELGQKSFEHGRIFMYECFPESENLRTSDNWKPLFREYKRSMVEDFDTLKATHLMKLMARKNAYWVPTLQTLKFEAFAHKDSFVDNPYLKYITNTRKKLWWGGDIKNNKKLNLSEESAGISINFYNYAKEQIKKANELGVPIMAGTDVTDSYTFAGFSLHDELKELTESGLSNLEALQSATIVPVQYANQDQKYGSITEGKIADIVILKKNPLKNINHSTTISSVILNGLYFDSKKIEEMKKYTQSNASSFHMNIKVFYSLIRSPLIRVQFKD